MSFSIVSWKYARLMSKSFTSKDKLIDIMIEPSTLLVESTDSSLKDVCATLLCRTRRFICASRLCLALEQSHKHLLNALSQSLPVPQSNAIALIPASSISSVISSSWAVPICTSPGSRATPDLQWISSCMSFPESSSLFQDRFPIKRSFWN